MYDSSDRFFVGFTLMITADSSQSWTLITIPVFAALEGCWPPLFLCDTDLPAPAAWGQKKQSEQKRLDVGGWCPTSLCVFKPLILRKKPQAWVKWQLRSLLQTGPQKQILTPSVVIYIWRYGSYVLTSPPFLNAGPQHRKDQTLMTVDIYDFDLSMKMRNWIGGGLQSSQ